MLYYDSIPVIYNILKKVFYKDPKFEILHIYLIWSTIEQSQFWDTFPVGIYLLEVESENVRAMCEICSKLTKKTSQTSFWCLCSYSWIHLFQGVSIADFEQVNVIL